VVIIWEGRAVGLDTAWATLSLISDLPLQVVDSRSLRTDALIGEFRVTVPFPCKQSVLNFLCSWRLCGQCAGVGTPEILRVSVEAGALPLESYP
jgi:hypothetical protein